MPSERLASTFRAAYGEGVPVKDRLAAVFELLRQGYIDSAREVLEQVEQRAPGLQRLTWLSQACARMRLHGANQDDRSGQAPALRVPGTAGSFPVRCPTDVMIIRAPAGASRVLVAFGGFTETFWLAPPFLQLADCHVIVLRDSRRMFHLAGVDGLGEAYAACVDALRQLAAELGADRLFLAGSSAGGYAALRYALDLEVRGVLAISPVTQLNAGEKELAQYPALRPIARTAPEMMQDIIPLYQRAQNPPKVIIAWGERHPLDNWQATRMQVLPNVALEPVGVAEHPVWIPLQARGQLAPLLQRLLAL
jgi:pimeloyl-ACP methyl ester carboxylesterase